MADIFICYARKDTDQVVQWVKRLEDGGFSVWMDVTSVDGATIWAREIVQAIDECKVLILMLTKGSADSHHVMKEVSLASEKNKKILPLKLESVDIPATLQYQLASIHFLELHRRDQDDALQAITRALSHHGIEPQKPVEEVAAPAAEPIPVVGPPREKLPVRAWRVVRAAGVGTWGKVWPVVKAGCAKMAPLVWQDPYALYKRIGLGVVGLLLLVLIIWASIPADETDAPIGLTTDTPGKDVVVSTQAPGLASDELPLAVQLVKVQWTKKGVITGITDSKSSVGPGGVLRAENGKLLVLTNSASLNIKRIGILTKITAYDVWVTFATGESRTATRFCDKFGGHDLALLEVDAKGLKVGKDYVVLPFRKAMGIAPGDETLVIKRAAGLDSTSTTQSTQRVVAVGSCGTAADACRAIYADTPVNDTNRGGLLLKKEGGKYFWVGINVFGTKETEARNTSIHAGDILNMRPKWYSCSPSGAAKALYAIYKMKAKAD